MGECWFATEEKMMELDKIYNEDCLVGMQRIPDQSVDAIICDLPYGTTQNEWDSVIPLEELWTEYRRICKPNAAIVLFSQQPFTATLVTSNPQMFRYEWIWQKGRGTGFLNANKMPMKAHENVLVFYKNLPTYNPIMREGEPYVKIRREQYSKNYGVYKPDYTTECEGGRFPIDVLQFKSVEGTVHPTQKPVDLIRYFVQTYTNEGDVVLDNCMGSGTTAIACIKEKRHFIGFELNEEYFNVAQTRIDNERRQLTIF